MDETSAPATRGRRPSGRDAKRAARTARAHNFVPYITRKIPYYEVLGNDGLELLEYNADTILEEIGIDFREDPEALSLFKAAGADVSEERVRFPRGTVPLAGQGDRAAGIHAVRAQPGPQRGHRRRQYRIRPRLRFAVHSQPR